MKKLFGLALVGLMAGTAGAACTVDSGSNGSDSTCVDVVKGASESRNETYGSIVVSGDYYTVDSTITKKHCENYTAKSNSLFSKAKCDGVEEGKSSYESKWTITQDTRPQVVTSDNAAATIDGEGETRLNAIKIPEDIAAASITYDRKFTRIYGVGYSTVTFPFSFKTECVDQTAGYGSSKSFAFYKAIGYENSSVVAKEETYEINAHQPYIVKTLLADHTENGIEINYIKFKTSAGCSYTLKKNYDAETEKFVESKYSFDAGSLNGTWNFMGTYEKIQFTADTKAGVYGFASAEKKDDQGKVVVKAGSFVKAGDNASVPPMRAYLVYNKNGFNKEGKPSPDGETSVASISDEDLPEVITVKFIDKDENGNEEITAIAQMNTRTGEISTDKNLWFDLKGRKLNKKPTVKGTYYNNGQKVIIK